MVILHKEEQNVAQEYALAVEHAERWGKQVGQNVEELGIVANQHSQRTIQ